MRPNYEACLKGFIEICCMHPLDVVKTRFQVQKGNSNYTSILDCFQKTIRNEGSHFLKSQFPFQTEISLIEQKTDSGQSIKGFCRPFWQRLPNERLSFLLSNSIKFFSPLAHPALHPM